MKKLINAFLNVTLGWTESVAAHLQPLGPLAARLVAGEVFITSGWGKLNNLDQITENFISWGIPYPHLLTPLTSGIEFLCGIFLVFGFLTRISAGALGIVMIVAIKSAKWDQVDSLDTLLGFDETIYLTLFFWLAIAGAGKLSIDYLLRHKVMA